MGGGANIANTNLQYYQTLINQKDQELNLLRTQLKNNAGNVPLVSKNALMTVNFISMDSRIHFAVPCVDTDVFAEIEEKLYKQFPEYRETNNSFVANGRPVLRFKTISENKIGTGLPVTMIVP